ncbi:MAG: component of SufBCD complex [Roseovarius sp.]|nr:component of SufBCD complex [Roseovarius sp.]
MNWYQNVFELIDFRSFSNLWFWLALAVTWSSASHWVLGVPWDMALRAKKGKNPQSVIDFEDMVRINTNRILFIAQESGLLLSGMVAFALTSLVLLGFVYDNEFSQAVFSLSLPLTLVGLLSVHTATRIKAEGLAGAALFKRLNRHRFIIQVIGVVSLFFTAMWGMYQNMNAGVLG